MNFDAGVEEDVAPIPLYMDISVNSVIVSNFSEFLVYSSSFSIL